MRYVLPTLLALVASLSASGAAAGAVERTLPGPVMYDVSSWGALLVRWRVNPDGTGEIWRGAGPVKGTGDIRKFPLTLDAGAMQEFASAVEPLFRQVKRPIRCKRVITDQPYGAVVFEYPGNRREWRFDAGCRSAVTDRAMAQLKQAHDIVERNTATDPLPAAARQPS